MVTFLEIAQRMADRLDETRPSTIYSADLSTLSQTVRRYREHINLAYNLILLALNRTNEYRQTSTTLSLVANTESYNIPSGILNIDQIQIATDPPMSIINWPDYETYKRQFLTVTDTGYPTVCAIYQRKIWFYPTPDQALTANIRGQESLTDLDLDADVPDLPTDFVRVLIEFAIYFEMTYEGNPSAGVLIVSENGSFQAQGGQASTAVTLFNMVRRNSGNHFMDAPRMMTGAEIQNKNALRRIIYF